MIVPCQPQEVPAVAAHYDDLDNFYREAWGEHVHHGLWETGRESPVEAVEKLTERVADLARIRPGDRVCDVGCGYGATARLLAARRGARVTGLSLSSAQLRFARAQSGDAPNPMYLLRDWLDNQLADESFDAVIVIESSEHVADKQRFFGEARRVLRPGGRFVVCSWIAADAPAAWQIRHLLEPVCREGRLAGLGTAAELRGWIEAAGLLVEEDEDVTRKVKRTWPLCIGRTIKLLAHDREKRWFLFRGRSKNRIFGLTMLRIWLAYETGAMRYHIVSARRPA